MRRHRRRSSWWRRHRFRLRRRLREVVIAGLFALALAAFAMWWIPSVGDHLAEKLSSPDDEGLVQMKEKEIKRYMEEFQRIRADGGKTTPVDESTVKRYLEEYQRTRDADGTPRR